MQEEQARLAQENDNDDKSIRKLPPTERRRDYIWRSVATRQCPHCSYAFHHGSALKRHLRLQHPWTQRLAERYGRSVRQAVLTHQLPAKRCRICNVSFENKSRLKAHFVRKHRQYFTCFRCANLFTSRRYRDAHASNQHRVNKIYCQYCPRSFCYEHTKRLHMVAHHRGTCAKHRFFNVNK